MAVDYEKVNDAMERTRQEIRRIVMAEGAAAERASIVEWLFLFAANMEETEAAVLHEVISSIKRGDHAQPKSARREGKDAR